MRVVRVQVFASQRYRGKDGYYDRRSITLEAEVESSDGQTSAIWDLQREADNALESWIEQHRFEEPPDPMLAEVEARPVTPPVFTFEPPDPPIVAMVKASPARSPAPSTKLSDDEIPY
jgi:hypothetical protein